MSTDAGSTYDNRVDGRHGNWMETASGNRFWPIDPRPEDVRITDIAAALSKQCRYAGHCQRFYSVAEHSVYVSHLVPEEHAFKALLHDATEAYIIDVPRPLKPYLPGYAELEAKVHVAIMDHFGLTHDMPAAIKQMDSLIILTERAQLMTPTDNDWCIEGEAPDVEIHAYSPSEAEALFLARYVELVAGVAVPSW